MSAQLHKMGYVLDSLSKVWIKLGYTSISYSDGTSVENRLKKVIAESKNINVFSPELKMQCLDWASTYHLSATRANLLRPFKDILNDADVLEIGAGCGALTRYMGECGANVIGLEGTLPRAEIARMRTRDLKNVEIIADDFNNFQWDKGFDVITLIGVLEYANLFTKTDNPHLTLLKKAFSLLNPKGKLIIGIENQLGIKYFAGAPEDHLGVSMYGIENRYKENQPQTFGKNVLTKLLKKSGFKTIEFLAPLPDYKLPISIITENGFVYDKFDAATLAIQSFRQDIQLPHYLSFSPELVIPSLYKNGIALDLANSFLIVANNTDANSLNQNLLAYHFTTGRLEKFCKETRFIKENGGNIVVKCQAISPQIEDDKEKSNLLDFNLTSQSTYFFGKPLSTEFLEILTKDSWDFPEIGAFLQRYLDIVFSIISPNQHIDIKSVDTKIPPECFDAIPQNIIIKPDGSWSLIDKEWTLKNEMPVGWLIFRTLLLQFQMISRLGQPKTSFPNTRKDFIYLSFKALGLDITDEQLNAFAKSELEVYAEVNNLIENSFDWGANSALQFNNLNLLNTDLSNKIIQLNTGLAEQINKLNTLEKHLLEKEQEIIDLNTNTFNLNQEISILRQTIFERDQQISKIDTFIEDKTNQINILNETINQQSNTIFKFQNSSSWKLMSPLRKIKAVIVGTASNQSKTTSIQSKNKKLLNFLSNYLWIVFGIFCLIISYLIVWQRGLYMDDYSMKFLGTSHTGFFWNSPNDHYPARILAWMLPINIVPLVPDYEIWIRIFQILLIALNVFIFGVLCYRLFKSKLIGIISGFLFISPILSPDIVLWTTASPVIISSSFALLSIIFIQYASYIYNKKYFYIFYIFFAAMCFITMMFSYEAPMASIGISILISFITFQENTKKILKSIGLTLLTNLPTIVAFGISTIIILQSPHVSGRGGVDITLSFLYGRVLTFIKGAYWLTISPEWGLKLLIETFKLGSDIILSSSLNLLILFTAIILLLLTVLTWKYEENDNNYSYRIGIMFFFVGTLWAIFSVLVPGIFSKGQILEARMFYFPTYGFCLMLSSVIWIILKRAKFNILLCKFFIALIGGIAIFNSIIILGYCQIYAERYKIDQQQFAAITKLLPSEKDIPKDAKLILYKFDENIKFDYPNNISNRLLAGVFETNWSASDSLRLYYDRKDIDSITQNRWNNWKFSFDSSENLIINEKEVLPKNCLFITYKEEKALLVSKLVLKVGDNEKTIEFPLANELMLKGFPAIAVWETVVSKESILN